MKQQIGTVLGLPVLLETSIRRKQTITIYVKPEHIVVRAPEKTPLKTIQSLLAGRHSWIERQVSQVSQRVMDPPSWPRSSILLHGQVYPIHYQHVHSGPFHIQVLHDKLQITGRVPSMDDPEVKQALTVWLQQRAKQTILQRVETWSQQLHCTFHSIRVKEVRSRWGSCSAKANLNFNWRLVMAPMDVLDYVVVHELCHLQELNHSARFWALVEQAMPDYQRMKRWLSENGAQLYF